MADPQLIDYIKKARSAGQGDDQTKTLLVQNGWSAEEINQAFSAINQPKPAEHQVSGQPEINIQQRPYQAKPSQTFQNRSQQQYEKKPTQSLSPETLYQKQPMDSQMPRTKSRGGSGLVLKLLAIFILLAVIGVGGYFALSQGDFINSVLSYFSPKVEIDSTQQNQTPDGGEDTNLTGTTPAQSELSTKTLVTVPDEYDASKINVTAFNQSKDKAAYCAPSKLDAYSISCFLNGQKFLDIPYAKRPYWIGISPNGQRIILLFYSSTTKKSFIFENGIESKLYDGSITYPKFSQDSKNFMFMIMGNDGKSFVVFNDKEFPVHEKIFTEPELSSDGKYVLYGARDGESILWVADEIQPVDQNE